MNILRAKKEQKARDSGYKARRVTPARNQKRYNLLRSLLHNHSKPERTKEDIIIRATSMSEVIASITKRA